MSSSLAPTGPARPVGSLPETSATWEPGTAALAHPDGRTRSGAVPRCRWTARQQERRQRLRGTYAAAVTDLEEPAGVVPTRRARRFAQESALARTRRARRIGRELAALYPQARCELDFRSPFELLVATVLSAQTTDVRVNPVTPALFARYPSAADLAGADRAELEALVQPTGFFRAKSDALLRIGARLVRATSTGRSPAAWPTW